VIERLRDDGKTIFLNSHILQEVELVCTRVAIMSQGQIRGSGRPEDLAAVSHIERVLVQTRPQESASAVADQAQILSWMAAASDGDLAADVVTSQNGQVSITFDAVNQTVIDAVIDALRRNDISISRLEVKRPTLEETFIKLVGESGDSDAPLAAQEAAIPAANDSEASRP
jgi:ABC-2 type transport system ATP-binding protein